MSLLLSPTSFVPSLLDKEASDAYGMLAERSLAASLRIAIISKVGCDPPSLFGIVGCPLLARATAAMMAVGVGGGF
jgi:hypothetical protein